MPLKNSVCILLLTTTRLKYEYAYPEKNEDKLKKTKTGEDFPYMYKMRHVNEILRYYGKKGLQYFPQIC